MQNHTNPVNMKIGCFTFIMSLCSLFLHLLGFSAPPPTYCTPNSVNGNQINPNKIWSINNLKLARLSSPYYANQGYSFLDLQAQYELFQGRAYRLTLNPSAITSDPNVQFGWSKVWIDFNGDGIFNDSEKVLSVFSQLAVEFSQVFAVPSNAFTNDAIRIRIVVSESEILSPCDDIQYGIMVDYSMKIYPSSQGQSADGYCLPVENFASQYIKTIAFDQALLVTGSTADSYKEVDYNATTFYAGITHSINLIPEQSNDINEFVWKVWLDINGNKDFENNELLFQGVSDENGINGLISIPSNAVSGKTRMRVSMGNPAIGGSCSYVEYGQIIDFTIIINHTYCIDFKSLDGGEYYIQKFSTPKLSKSSGPGPYSDFTTISPFIDMFCVSSWSYDLAVNVKTPFANSSAFVIAAIDFNHDELFTKDEIVVPSTVVPGNQLVSLPAFIACNPKMIQGEKTRFRIVSSNQAFPSDFDFCNLNPEAKGEVEDYTVSFGSIVVGPPFNEKPGAKEATSEVVVYPNPANESVRWIIPMLDRLNYELCVTDFMGVPILHESGIGSGGTFDVSGMEGIYLMRVNYEDGTSFVGRISVVR